MIDPRCDSCGKELMEKGAVLLSPPVKSVNKFLELDEWIDVVRKFHICRVCYDELIEKFFAKPPSEIDVTVEF
jgi:hypothetical protein